MQSKIAREAGRAESTVMGWKGLFYNEVKAKLENEGISGKRNLRKKNLKQRVSKIEQQLTTSKKNKV